MIMKKRKIWTSVVLLLLFVLWTIAVKAIDLGAVGPNGSVVGFSAINKFVHDLTDVNFELYNITDWLGLVPVVIGACFAILGFVQWIIRKSVLKVDADILLLGGFYVVVFAIYMLFERVVINYRPVLINGLLEASYPSSTTMLVMCVMPTAMLQVNHRLKSRALKRSINTAILAFVIFMVIGRLLSGVHWITDIIGGALCSSGLVLLYDGLLDCILRRANERNKDISLC